METKKWQIFGRDWEKRRTRPPAGNWMLFIHLLYIYIHHQLNTTQVTTANPSSLPLRGNDCHPMLPLFSFGWVSWLPSFYLFPKRLFCLLFVQQRIKAVMVKLCMIGQRHVSIYQRRNLCSFFVGFFFYPKKKNGYLLGSLFRDTKKGTNLRRTAAEAAAAKLLYLTRKIWLWEKRDLLTDWLTLSFSPLSGW